MIENWIKRSCLIVKMIEELPSIKNEMDNFFIYMILDGIKDLKIKIREVFYDSTIKYAFKS